MAPKLHKDGGATEGWRAIFGTSFDEECEEVVNYTTQVSRYNAQHDEAILRGMKEINQDLYLGKAGLNYFFELSSIQEFPTLMKERNAITPVEGPVQATDLTAAYLMMSQEKVATNSDFSWNLVTEHFEGQDTARGVEADADLRLKVSWGYRGKYQGHEWSRTEGTTKALYLKMSDVITRSQYFIADGKIFHQNTGLPIGGPSSGGKTKLILNADNWKWVEEKSKDPVWLKSATEQGKRLLFVFSYIDDRWATKEAANLLPDEKFIGIPLSSKEITDKASYFIGSKITLLGEPGKYTHEFHDKRFKIPTVDIVRYSHNDTAMPLSNVVGSICGRLVEIRKASSTDELFLKGAEETFSQIAERGHVSETFLLGISKFLHGRYTGHLEVKLRQQLLQTAKSAILSVAKATPPLNADHLKTLNTSMRHCAVNVCIAFWNCVCKANPGLNRWKEESPILQKLCAAQTTEEKDFILETLNANGKFTDSNSQQSAVEVFQGIVELIAAEKEPGNDSPDVEEEDELDRGTQRRTAMYGAFATMYTEQHICSKCKKFSKQTVNGYHIAMPWAIAPSALNTFLVTDDRFPVKQGETFKSDNCPYCRNHNKWTQTFKIDSIPKFLTVAFQRQSGDRQQKKLTYQAKIPMMSEFFGAKYEPFFMVEHRGSGAKSGHFVATAKVHGTWWTADTASVKPANIRSALLSQSCEFVVYQRIGEAPALDVSPCIMSTPELLQGLAANSFDNLSQHHSPSSSVREISPPAAAQPPRQPPPPTGNKSPAAVQATQADTDRSAATQDVQGAFQPRLVSPERSSMYDRLKSRDLTRGAFNFWNTSKGQGRNDNRRNMDYQVGRSATKVRSNTAEAPGTPSYSRGPGQFVKVNYGASSNRRYSYNPQRGNEQGRDRGYRDDETSKSILSDDNYFRALENNRGGRGKTNWNEERSTDYFSDGKTD